MPMSSSTHPRGMEQLQQGDVERVLEALARCRSAVHLACGQGDLVVLLPGVMYERLVATLRSRRTTVGGMVEPQVEGVVLAYSGGQVVVRPLPP